MNERVYSLLDEFLINLDVGVRTVFGRPETTGRERPRGSEMTADLSAPEKRKAEGLMRVNHVGEVCAQALYQGQALTARDPDVRAKLAQSAQEENDHLIWCEDRLLELSGRTSYLNPLWYLGSFGIGVAAGFVGDRWSLGFLAETERQVVRHLDSHLQRLPSTDTDSRAIVAQMRLDESHHATVAVENGAADLPDAVKKTMTACSKVMTGLAYWI
jgi:ubiquinone biosynthesis monooxygenase Coq7